ncbi:unnamed protein product, partial [Ectocarpus sp. 13 AM-2016]
MRTPPIKSKYRRGSRHVKGNTVASWFVLGNKDIMRYLAEFMDQD